MTLLILASLLAKHPTVTEALEVLVNAQSGQAKIGPKQQKGDPPMKMSLEAWKALMRTSIDGIEGALSVADPTPQKAKLADLRKRIEGPSVARHRKRLEDELDALVESDVAMQIASRRYLGPKVQEAVEKALVTLERAKRVLAKAAEMRKRTGKKPRSRRPVTPAR
jgi:hypothetical protein